MSKQSSRSEATRKQTIHKVAPDDGNYEGQQLILKKRLAVRYSE